VPDEHMPQGNTRRHVLAHMARGSGRVAVLARKPRARALSSIERHIGPKESTERHILANQGALDVMSWPVMGY
jgi:hypothetical protein